MRNLLQFFIKYSNIILFLLLEVVSVVLLIRSNSYPQSIYATSANRVIGEIYSWSDGVQQFLHLRTENRELTEENALLYKRITDLENLLEPQAENREELLLGNNVKSDSGQHIYRYSHLNIQYIPARVIQVDAGKTHNYFTINKGRRDSLHTDMGVVGANGAVGIVTAVGENYSIVMPIINEKMMLSCRLKNGVYSPLQWDGISTQYAQLHNIARHTQVAVGDTIVTSGLTTTFPEGIPVGIITETDLRESDAYYRIKVKLLTDFSCPRYVQVIENRN